MEKLRIVLDWFPNTNHTGILLAKKYGWLEENGIDLTIEGEVHGEMEVHGADFVCGPEIAMLECMNRGIGLTAVAAYTQKCDSGIVSLKESHITRPRELEGKRLTHWTPQWFHQSIGRLVANDGGDYSKVNLVNLDVGDIVDTLGNIADATWVYENWENYELMQAGKEINYFNLGDIDPVFKFVAPAIAATYEVLAERPEAVRAMLAAFDRGYQAVAKDPSLVLEVKDMIEPRLSDEWLVKSQEHLAPIFLNENGHWGTISAERWEPMAEFLVENGVIDHRFENEYTNEYLQA